MLVLDATAVAKLSVTALGEMTQLERELGQRGVTAWIAALPPASLRTAKLLPRWQELDEAGQLHPTVLGAVHAFRQR